MKGESLVPVVCLLASLASPALAQTRCSVDFQDKSSLSQVGVAADPDTGQPGKIGADYLCAFNQVFYNRTYSQFCPSNDHIFTIRDFGQPDFRQGTSAETRLNPLQIPPLIASPIYNHFHAGQEGGFDCVDFSGTGCFGQMSSSGCTAQIPRDQILDWPRKAFSMAGSGVPWIWIHPQLSDGSVVLQRLDTIEIKGYVPIDVYALDSNGRWWVWEDLSPGSWSMTYATGNPELVSFVALNQDGFEDGQPVTRYFDSVSGFSSTPANSSFDFDNFAYSW
jgi:hypothetical protein